MKLLIINNPATTFIGDSTGKRMDSCSIIHEKENWSIMVDTTEDDRVTQREVALITIRLPGGKVWTGTITDFAHVFTAIRNTIHDRNDPSEGGLLSTDTDIELIGALSHLK